MNRIFGQSKGSTVPKPTLNDTASTLDSRVETVNKQIAAIDQELQAYSKLPPARKAGQKARAMSLLSKKKMYERQRMTLEGQASNIGATAFAVSNIETQKQIFTGLKDAKKQLVKGYKDLKPEKVETLMDDLDDQLLDHEEMNDMFSRPIGQDSFLNDADLENELAGLAEEEFGMDSNAMYNDLHAPSVPVQPLDGGHAGVTTKDGVMVDEFGLPKLPASGMKN
jgi:charged multivesicular body protein 5